MYGSPRNIRILLLLTCVSATALAQATVLDLKVGTWEVTSTVKVEGTAQTSTQEQCLTKEAIQKSAFMPSEQAGEACKQTIVSSTRNSIDMKFQCAGAPGGVEMHMEALSNVSTKGTTRLTMMNEGKPMTIESSFTGKWVRADCRNSQ